MFVCNTRVHMRREREVLNVYLSGHSPSSCFYLLIDIYIFHPHSPLYSTLKYFPPHSLANISTSLHPAFILLLPSASLFSIKPYPLFV